MTVSRPAGLFVTGTDTGVGKTIVSAWLARCLAASYWKPIQCGADEKGRTDSHCVAELAGLSPDRIFPEQYLLADPVSPHEAARREGVSIDWQTLVMPSHLHSPDRPVIVEGAGGALVPVTSSHTMIDVMAILGLPVVVVARTALGTINHSLLTLEALKMRQQTVAGIVFSGLPEPHVRDAVIGFGDVPLIAELPYLSPCTAQTMDQMASTIRPHLEQTLAELALSAQSDFPEKA